MPLLRRLMLPGHLYAIMPTRRALLRLNIAARCFSCYAAEAPHFRAYFLRHAICCCRAIDAAV